MRPSSASGQVLHPAATESVLAQDPVSDREMELLILHTRTAPTRNLPCQVAWRTRPRAPPVPPAGRDAPPAARLPATAPRPVRSLNTKLTTIKPRASCHERGKTRGRSGSLRDGQPDRDAPLRHRWARNSGRRLWRGLTGSRARSTGSIPRPNNGQGSTASAIADLARSLRGTISWTDGAATEGGQVPGAIQSAPGVDRPS